MYAEGRISEKLVISKRPSAVPLLFFEPDRRRGGSDDPLQQLHYTCASKICGPQPQVEHFQLPGMSAAVSDTVEE